MRKLRLLLLPFGAVSELLILLTCWVLAAFRPKLAERLMKWATATLPSLYWYIGESS